MKIITSSNNDKIKLIRSLSDKKARFKHSLFVVEGVNLVGDMPKMKTSRAAAKRFKVTGTGKLKRSKAYKRHILTKKTTKKKRELRKPVMTDATNVKNMKKILPYL